MNKQRNAVARNLARARRLGIDATALIESNAKLEPTTALIALVVCGRGKQRAYQLNLPSNWTEREAFDLMAAAMQDLDAWAAQDVPHAAICEGIGHVLMTRAVALSNRDPGYRNTALLLMHVDGAVYVGVPAGDAAVMRQQIKDIVEAA